MAKPFKLLVVTPERKLVDTQVLSLIAPGINGSLGVLYGHLPMTVALQTGYLKYQDVAYAWHFLLVTGGFMEIKPNEVIVLADGALSSTEIDQAEAEKLLEHARKALKGEESGMSTEQAIIELEHSAFRAIDKDK